MRPGFVSYVDQVRRRWWVVLLVAALTVILTTSMSLGGHPKYVGTSTLLLSTPGRSPEQDRTTVLGLTTVFNDPATQARLKNAAGIPDAVVVSARTVASSSILAVDATADDPATAQQAASTMAKAFRSDVVPSSQKTLDVVLDQVSGQLKNLQDSSPGAADQVTELRTILDALRSTSINRIQELQVAAGVREVPTHGGMILALAAAGGLLLGLLVALISATASPRVRNSAELLVKTGVSPLVELPGRTSDSELFGERIRLLANIVSASEPGRAVAVVPVDAPSMTGAASLAAELAAVLAAREYRTALVTDRDTATATATSVDTPPHFVSGSGLFATERGVVTREKTVTALEALRADADIIVISAPASASRAETQLVCAVADQTVLVTDSASARAPDIRAAFADLQRAGVRLLGIVVSHGE